MGENIFTCVCNEEKSLISSQEPRSQKSSNSLRSRLTKCKIKFVELMATWVNLGLSNENHFGREHPAYRMLEGYRVPTLCSQFFSRL